MQRIVLSVDAMGGARAPEALVEGMSVSAARYSALHFLVFGDEPKLKTLLSKTRDLLSRCELIHTTTVVDDRHSPLYAFKNGRNSSMRKAVDAVSQGLAHACVSCGNTGALLVTAKLVLGTLEGVKRPAIAGVFPTAKGRCVMLDMGANNECSEAVLFQFALMGRCLAKVLLDLSDPTIGILNVGEEETKGRDLEQKTAKLLSNSGLNFFGYIEGHDIAHGKADVVVTDGFSGNLVLKASEGAVDLCISLLKSAAKESGVLAMLGGLLLRKALKKSLSRIDPNVNNGAMLVGLNGIVVKSHGAASALGIANAINVAYDLALRDVNAQITREMQMLAEQGIGLNFVDKLKKTSVKLFGAS